MTRERAEEIALEEFAQPHKLMIGCLEKNEYDTIVGLMVRVAMRYADEVRREEREHQQELVCSWCGTPEPRPFEHVCEKDGIEMEAQGPRWTVVRAEFERRKGEAG